jgi:hypothetical protein
MSGGGHAIDVIDGNGAIHGIDVIDGNDVIDTIDVIDGNGVVHVCRVSVHGQNHQNQDKERSHSQAAASKVVRPNASFFQ